MVFSHWSRTKEICKPVYAAKVISWALLWLWHLFHVIHYNHPNLKIVEVLAIDRMLTWEKNESLTVSSFCRSYRNTVTDITQSKKCMQNFSVRSGAVRTRVGSPRSNHETTKFALHGFKIYPIIFLLNVTYSLQVVFQLLQRVRGNSYT